MSDQQSQITQSNDALANNPPSAGQLPPPSGDSEKADKYISQLIDLISTDKLLVSHTDLAKFDPTSLQDHYRMDLKDYEVEVSHNKQADSGQDSYIILFNNLKFVNDKCTEKVILAYMNLTEAQFKSFKSTTDEYLDRKRREAEEKRLREAMTPIDDILTQLTAPAPEPAELAETDSASDQTDQSIVDDNPPPTFAAPA